MLFGARIVKVVVAFVILCVFIYYEHLGDSQFQKGADGNLESFPQPGFPISQEGFVSQALSSAIEDDFDDSHIGQMCDGQRWDKAVVFTCRGIIGGIGNIRQEILHCIRYAIDAGAGLLVPIINLRSESNLSNLQDGIASMDYLFDRDRFISRLKTACPQMPIYKDMEELKAVGPVTETEAIELRKLPHWPMTLALSAKDRVKELSAPHGQISLIPFEHVWQYFPICHDPVGFADTFGNLIPLRQDVHRLAATILYELYFTYHLPIEPSVTTSLPGSHTFLGIHLRTENDILPEWLKYSDQAAYYLSHIDSSKFITSLPVIYIASGNATSVHDFNIEAESLNQPKTIVTKHDLLFGDDLAELKALTWDQQALVDLLILSRSAFFMGMADSTFAWTIAVDRRKTSEAGSCGYRKSKWKSKLWGTALSDEFSDLMGNHEYGWEGRMWP